MQLSEYVQVYDSHVMHWSHVKTRVNINFVSFLHELKSLDVQILYANTAEVERPDAFNMLCELLLLNRIWGVNLGEIRFSHDQCIELIKVIRNSKVCFMFVDAILVGKEVVREMKDIIRDRRRNTKEAPWIISDDVKQNEIIMRCRNMWFSPYSLGRNKTKLMSSKISVI